MTDLKMPASGSVLTGPGPAPVKFEPPQKAEVGKLYTLEDVDPIGRTEVLIYGPPGSCKTMLWSTFPPPFRVIDADYGLKTLRWAFKAGKSALHCMGEHCIQAYRPVEPDAYPINPQAFDKMCDMIAYWFSPEQVDKWQTLVIDSATEVNMWAIYKALHLNGLLPDVKHALSKSDSVNEQAKTLLLTGQQDYKSAQGLFMGALTDIRVDCAKFNKNLVLVCHEWVESEEDREGRMIVSRYEPWLIGQLRTRVAKDFDDIWATALFNGKDPKVQMHADPKHVTKTRWGQVPDIEKDFDFREMLKKVKLFHGVK
jgi:hypothetical protein